MTLKSFWKIFCMILLSQKIWNFVRQSGMLYFLRVWMWDKVGFCIVLWFWVWDKVEVLYVFGSLSVKENAWLKRMLYVFVSLSVSLSGIFICFCQSECNRKWNLYVFVRLSVWQNIILYVFVRLSGAFVCVYESECEIKWNFVRQSGNLYVFESLSVRQSGIL